MSNENTGLMDISALMDGSAITVTKVERDSSFYPDIKMHHAIQTDLDDPNCLHLYGVEDTPIKLKKGWSFTVLLAKDAIRELREKENGKGNFYYKWYGNFEDEHMVEQLAKMDDFSKKKHTGRVYLGVLSIGNNKAIVNIDTFGVMTDYFNMLMRAQISTKKKITFDIENHKENLQKSQNGKGSYFSPKKMKQYTVSDLTNNEFETIKDMMVSNMPGITDWKLAKTNEIIKND